MNKLIILGLFFTLMFGIIPQHYEFDNEGLRSLENSEDWSLPYNSVRDIYQGYENKLFFGTSGGLGYAFINQLDNIQFGTFINESLPQGGNPALITKEDVIAVSGSGLVEHSGGYYPAGTGIGYSINNGESWSYKVQPVDSIPINGHFQTFSWGGQELNQLAVTTEINNITYDLAIVRDYIYSTSWAGGLRRFQFQNFNPAMPDEDPNPWEIIPLPMDNQSTLQCGIIDAENFELNPNNPSNGGSNNHKAFSVYTSDDTTIWVGTAAGINKGIIDTVTECINWEHYKAITHGFSGNWVIGFTHQEFENYNRIWAITWSTYDGFETNAISFSDNNGITWSIATQIEELNIKVYNLSSHGDVVYASTEDGLYITFDGEYWAKFPSIKDNDGQIILSEKVYAALYTDINGFDNLGLWIGTPDGIAQSYNQGINWDIYRFWELPAQNNNESSFYAYPNPFYINEVNQFEGDGHVRFVFNDGNYGADLDIFNFSMEKIIHLKNSNIIQNDIYSNGNGEFIWNGRNSNGFTVANGVYFCRLTNKNNVHWTKVVVIN